jgi:hypothetical protein
VAFEPYLEGGVAQQELAIGVAQERSQVQRRVLLLDVHVGDHGGAVSVRAPRHLGVPAGIDETHERIDRGRHRRRLMRCTVRVCFVAMVAFPVGDHPVEM